MAEHPGVVFKDDAASEVFAIPDTAVRGRCAALVRCGVASGRGQGHGKIAHRGASMTLRSNQ